MALSYEPLWNFLNQRAISKMEFAKRIEISNATLAKMGKNEPVTLTIIEKICDEFNCSINDIVVHIPSNRNKIPVDMLKAGTIVECPCVSISCNPKLKMQRIRNNVSPLPCVVINKIINDNNNFLIAPLSFDIIPESFLDIPFKDASILSEKKQGYIQLSKLGTLNANYIVKILGNISNDYVEINLINTLSEMAPTLIKQHLINESVLYNFGIIN